MHRRQSGVLIGLGVIHLQLACAVVCFLECLVAVQAPTELRLFFQLAVPVGVSLAQGAAIGAIAIIGKRSFAFKIFVLAMAIVGSAYLAHRLTNGLTLVFDGLVLGYVRQPIVCGVGFATLHVLGIRIAKGTPNVHSAQFTLKSLGTWILGIAFVLALTLQTPAIRESSAKAWKMSAESTSAFAEATILAVLAIVSLFVVLAPTWRILTRIYVVVLALSVCAATKWYHGHFVDSFSASYSLVLYLIYVSLMLIWFFVLRALSYELTFVPIRKHV